MTPNAEKMLAWVDANLAQHTRQIRGQTCPVVNLWWHGMARALGFADDNAPGATRASLDALDELRAAGKLAWYCEGPETYGHTTTCRVPGA